METFTDDTCNANEEWFSDIQRKCAHSKEHDFHPKTSIEFGSSQVVSLLNKKRTLKVKRQSCLPSRKSLQMQRRQQTN